MLEFDLQSNYSGAEACFSWLKKQRLQRMVSYTLYNMVEALSFYFVLFSAPNAEMIFTVISLVFSCEYQPAHFLASLHIMFALFVVTMLSNCMLFITYSSSQSLGRSVGKVSILQSFEPCKLVSICFSISFSDFT